MTGTYKRLRFWIAAIIVLYCCAISCNNKVSEPQKPAPAPPINKVELDNSFYAPVDKSPMDVSYFPADYPMQKMTGTAPGDLIARVVYSRPQKNGRDIFVDTSITTNFIQHYGQEWRLGANEATEIEFFKDISIKGKKFNKGRYVIFCIPYPDKWIIYFNSNLFSWGLHMDRSKDITFVELPIKNTTVPTEYFSMLFQKAAYGCDLIMAWGNVEVTMPIHSN